MSDPSTILLLLALAGSSLIIVSFINQRQTRARIIGQKLNQMKRRVSELEDLSSAIESLVESEKIPQVVCDDVIDMLSGMLNVDPHNSLFQISLDNAKMRRQDLENSGAKSTLNRLMESDAAIAKAHFTLNEAARIIRKRQSADKLQAAEVDTLLQDLSWADLMVDVISNVGQGHKAFNNGDVLRAFAFYRKALEVIIQAKHKDERQNDIISELGEILNNKRRALSPRLMPETQYNPTKSAAKVTAE